MIIYKVTNKVSGKCYVGQTCRTLAKRKAEHLQAAANIKRSKYPSPLHFAISTQGSGEFVWEVLEECSSYDHLNERERFYIDVLDSIVPNGFNQTIGGHMDGDMSEEARGRISDAVAALHQDPTYRARCYPKLKGLVPPNKGVPMSDEQKEKVSAARKAVYNDPTYVNPNVGMKRTGKALENLHNSYKTRELPTGAKWEEAHGNQYTAEVRAKMRAAKVGKKPANTKKVRCIETGQIFNGLTEASDALNVNRQSIYMQIKGKIKAAGGLHFEYVS